MIATLFILFALAGGRAVERRVSDVVDFIYKADTHFVDREQQPNHTAQYDDADEADADDDDGADAAYNREEIVLPLSD
uniref:Secreted protein n=1 Tax=Angiostrongylus cantonensis TaxID=6313 RepID=A0A0K0DBF8_ANGCA